MIVGNRKLKLIPIPQIMSPQLATYHSITFITSLFPKCLLYLILLVQKRFPDIIMVIYGSLAY